MKKRYVITLAALVAACLPAAQNVVEIIAQEIHAPARSQKIKPASKLTDTSIESPTRQSAPQGKPTAPEPQSPAPRSASFVFRNVRVFDGTRVAFPRGQIWVEDGKIKSIGKEIKTPTGVQTIDGSGDTVLPGLIDSHVHTYPGALKQALIFGVTTELEMAGFDPKFLERTKQEEATGKNLDVADLRSAGILVTAPGGHGTEYGAPIPTINGPAEAQSFVDARIAEGSDYIKIIYDDGSAYNIRFQNISKETMAAVVTAAHRRGKMAVVHVATLQGARDAIDAEADGLAHIFADRAPDPDFAPFVAAHHAFVIPTLTVVESTTGVASGASISADLRLDPYLSPMLLANLKRSFPSRGTLQFANATAAVRQLKAARVPLLAGTDAPNPGTAHGASMHRELELLVHSGLTPTEALAAATSIPASIFHLDDRGQLAPGKRADLLLVKGDPTADITTTRDIIGVWKLGRPADREGYRAAVTREREQLRMQQLAPPPPGSESGLISDFNDGKPSTRFGAGWSISTDSMRGGKSTAEMKVVEGGANGDKGALEVTGNVDPTATIAWAGVIFFPGATPMAPVNLSSKKILTFWAKGDGKTYQIMLFTRSGGPVPATKTFIAGAEWKQFSFPLAAFSGTDGHDLTGIFWGGGLTPGSFALILDNVHLD